MRSDWMPGRREEQLQLAKTWLRELPVANGAWTVTEYEISELTDRAEDAEKALDRLGTGGASAVNIARAKEAFASLVQNMRFLHKRKFFSPPMIESDWRRLELKPPDEVRTTHFEVLEMVEFETKLRDIREVVVNFWIKGAAHRAKPAGYDGAVFIWDVLDALPADPSALTQHEMASKTPHSLKFREEQRGKTVYIAAAWQNERGILGEWSEIQSAIIP